MKKFNSLDWFALVLVLIGAIAFGLNGFFDYDAIWEIFGEFTTAAKLIYDVLAIAGFYLVISIITKKKA